MKVENSNIRCNFLDEETGLLVLCCDVRFGANCSYLSSICILTRRGSLFRFSNFLLFKGGIKIVISMID